MTQLGGTIRPTTLARVRALHALVQHGQQAQAQLDDILTAAVEADGHDLAAFVMTALDTATGDYKLGPREGAPSTAPSPNGTSASKEAPPASADTHVHEFAIKDMRRARAGATR